MKVMQLLFKDTKNLVTTSLKEIAVECKSSPTEFEVLRTLKEMEKDNEIAIIPVCKNK